MGFKTTLASLVLAGACVLGAGDKAKADPILRDYYNQGDNATHATRNGLTGVQSFHASSDYELDKIRLKLSGVGGFVELCPVGDSFLNRNQISYGWFDSPGPELTWVDIQMDRCQLNNQQEYYILLHSTTDDIHWALDSSQGYLNGDAFEVGGSSGLSYGPMDADFMFETYEVPEPFTVSLLALGSLGLLRRKNE